MIRQLTATQRGWLDFFLGGLAGSVTVYSLGMALSYEPIGQLFAALVAIGTFFSYFLNRRFGTYLRPWISTILYIALAIAAPFVSFNFNSKLPGGGFPIELLGSAGPLCWMIAICSFVAWRDQLLLFQAIPCIALFGLIGAFNTFNGATFTFFVFMISTALLYARSHQRVMLDRALQSGFVHVAAIRSGPWRWVAGPEWGLLSAAVVILLSVIGAPLLQFSVQGVSGVVKIKPPQVSPTITNPLNSALGGGASAAIGQGPRGRLSERDVFHINVSEPEYLRSGTFRIFDGRGWISSPEPRRPYRTNPQTTNFPYIVLRDQERYFDVTPVELKFTSLVPQKIPTPFPWGSFENFFEFRPNPEDRTITLRRLPPPNFVFKGTYLNIKPSVTGLNTPNEKHVTLDDHLDLEHVPARVRDWAVEVSQGADTDWEKAMRIKRAIEGQSKYNLNAEPTPLTENPIDYFLFGPKREGYCDLFASSMVLMARAAGLEARYAVGYYPVNGEKDDQGWYILRESEAHAWAEIYFEHIGWVPFDATEGAAAVPGGERGTARDSERFYQQAWFSWAVNGILVIGVFALVGYAVVTGRQQLGTEQLKLMRLGKAYEKFVESVEGSAKIVKISSESPDEFLARAASSNLMNQPEAFKLNHDFVVAFYAGPTVEEESIIQLEKGTDAYRTSLKRKP